MTRFSTWVLAGPLSVVVGLVIVVQLGTWIPHYLTWPYWPDHDVFANVARAWQRGELPYRDGHLNNFPGTVYVFYVLGKLVGWGHPWSFYAFDVVLVLALTIVLPLWSRQTFGRVLPGLVGSLSFLHYYLNLDYCVAAQRDWQGPCCLILAILIVQGWPGRAGRVVSAFLAAFALSIRPQTVLLWPALGFAVISAGEPVDLRTKLRRGAVWLAFLATFAALWFMPLVVNGILGDFLRSLRVVAFGSKYNHVGEQPFAIAWLFQPGVFRWMIVAIATLWLTRAGEAGVRWTSMAWVIALAGASFYKPLSPFPHFYLDIPLAVVGSVALAVLAGLILSVPAMSANFRLVGVLGLIGLWSGTSWPAFSVGRPNLQVWETLRGGNEPVDAPPGYRPGSVLSAAFYPWADYRSTLLYLRTHTSPSTRVANALKGMPAIVSEVDRPSAFPAESLAWLVMVHRDDEPRFADSLEKWPDSVVVWSPGEIGPVPNFKIERIEAAIRRLYQFEARFGTIEVWRRRSDPTIP